MWSFTSYSPYLHYQLVPSLKIIKIGKNRYPESSLNSDFFGGNLVTCFFNADHFQTGNR